LKNNWQGYELLQAKVKKSPHKYGNNDTVADTYASAMASYFANKVNNVPNSRGGVYKAIFHSARAFVRQGEKTGALPDGRLAGEELSKNASAVPGMDKNGVTAVINSATALDLSLADSGACLDIMLHPSSVFGEEGLEIFYGVLNTYMKKGGASVHFNVFSSDALRDAQKNPEKYKNLQVRVCGWNVLWNNMSQEEQNAYIIRAENIQ
jgi:formate C-acetyltransferase